MEEEEAEEEWWLEECFNVEGLRSDAAVAVEENAGAPPPSFVDNPGIDRRLSPEAS